jgi:isopenicillin N synthase-like dioxygenase
MSLQEMGIPSVDLADFIHGTAEQKSNFVKALGDAYETIGFVAVKNHLIDETTTRELYDQVQNFFALSPEVKKKYEIEGLAGQRGYTSFGKEHAKGSNAGDLKEFWHFESVQRPRKHWTLYASRISDISRT